jgi:hypothetical protein
LFFVSFFLFLLLCSRFTVSGLRVVCMFCASEFRVSNNVIKYR